MSRNRVEAPQNTHKKYVKFNIKVLYIILFWFSNFRKFGTGNVALLLRSEWNCVYACTVKKCYILKVQIAFVQSAHRFTGWEGGGGVNHSTSDIVQNNFILRTVGQQVWVCTTRLHSFHTLHTGAACTLRRRQYFVKRNSAHPNNFRRLPPTALCPARGHVPRQVNNRTRTQLHHMKQLCCTATGRLATNHVIRVEFRDVFECIILVIYTAYFGI